MSKQIDIRSSIPPSLFAPSWKDLRSTAVGGRAEARLDIGLSDGVAEAVACMGESMKRDSEAS